MIYQKLNLWLTRLNVIEQESRKESKELKFQLKNSNSNKQSDLFNYN
jgi:hypothetical protein